MVFNPTLCIQTAVTWVPADSVDTSLIFWAFFVHHASSHLYGLHRMAGTASAADITRWTHADHGPDRYRSNHDTFGRSVTRFQYHARILTFVVQTGKSGWTFWILPTLWLWFWLAVDVRVSFKTISASAQSDVVVHQTFGSGRTRTIVDARVDTLRVPALSISRTVAVRYTSDDVAPFKWISSVTAETSALSSVLVYVTFGIDAARIFDQARIDAVSVNTSLSRLAFRIDATTDCVTGDVRIAFEAVQT